MGNNGRKRHSEILYICWKPMFAAIMTGILAEKTAINGILLGTALGIAATIACYFDIKGFLKKEVDSPSESEEDFKL